MTEDPGAMLLPLVLYLAGPMTGLPRWGFDLFTEAAAALRVAGYTVASPHEHDLANGFDPDSDGAGFDLHAAMRWDVDAVLRADGVALLPGWERSQGVSVEITVAAAVGARIETVETWLDLATLESAASA